MNKEIWAKEIIDVILQKGHQALLAGGCVRDKLRSVEPKDYDIATSATPDLIQQWFPKTVPVGVDFGVVIVLHNGVAFEVTTFRKEDDYVDGRHPNQVSFTNVEEDAKRRDFTVNGLYFDTKKNKVLDFVEGQKDLKAKIIRTIGNPDERFKEDHLRMMRAIRFSMQLGFSIEPATLASIKRNAPLLKSISQERIREEFTKILISATPGDGIRLLDETGLLIQFMPEIEKMKGVEQPMEFHPEGDVYIHTMMLMDGLCNAPLELAMGCLLHDVAKPETFVRAADRIRFHGHDTIGADRAREICKRMTYSNDQTDLICDLVLHHLRFKDAFQMRTSTLKRFLGLPRFDLHLELHRLDCMASHKILEAHKFCTEKWQEFQKEPPPPTKIVGGKELIELGHRPGPEFTKILRLVEDEILENRIHSKEEAINWIKKNFPATKKGAS